MKLRCIWIRTFEVGGAVEYGFDLDADSTSGSLSLYADEGAFALGHVYELAAFRDVTPMPAVIDRGGTVVSEAGAGGG